MTEPSRVDIVVAGAGPAGLACALALAGDGFSVAVVAPPRQPDGARDTRTAALFPGSVALLDNLGVWERCRPLAAPLTAIRIVDAIGAPLMAPEVLFRAGDAGLDAFASNVPTWDLTLVLRAAAEAHGPELVVIEGAVTALSLDDTEARVHLDDGRIVEVRLVVGADGRNSICRRAAGIATRAWSYDQSAISCIFDHGRLHGGVSTEFHTRAGPLTTVPLPGRTSSLVWVERPAMARRLASLGGDVFRAALEHRLQGLLGTIGAVGPRSAFPLSGLAAETLAARRLALVGEAGHVLPPIGAQGLNLGLRDAAALADRVHDAAKESRDIGGSGTLDRYAKDRSADVLSRATAVDLLNRSLLLSSLPAVHLARGLGLLALSSIAPLRRRVLRESLEPPGPCRV